MVEDLHFINEINRFIGCVTQGLCGGVVTTQEIEIHGRQVKICVNISDFVRFGGTQDGFEYLYADVNRMGRSRWRWQGLVGFGHAREKDAQNFPHICHFRSERGTRRLELIAPELQGNRNGRNITSNVRGHVQEAIHENSTKHASLVGLIYLRDHRLGRPSNQRVEKAICVW